MELILDHQQRINLIGMLDTVDVKGRELFAVHDLQEKLDLDEEEKDRIEYREELVNGEPATKWNPRKSISPRRFEFDELDWNRIERAVKRYEDLLMKYEGEIAPGAFRWLRGIHKQLNGAMHGASTVG
jgi:hypothetical protein